jgi:uncharacterized protein
MRSAIDGGSVLVTGASSGIGLEIARQVAPRAKTLILVARRVGRLEELKNELLEGHPQLRVEVLPCDLSDREQTKRLPGELVARGLEIDVLVNNAGVGLMGMFDLADPDRVISMIDLNVTSLTLLTRALVPGMIARGHGGILNISSGFGLGVLPSFAAYVATKHYVTGFTEALIADLAGTGVTVTQVCPGPVATEFEQQIGNWTGASAPKAVEISAAECARASIRGFDRKKPLVVPGFVISLVLLANGMSPRFVRRALATALGALARKKELAARSAS